jgi:hypothetical protein
VLSASQLLRDLGRDKPRFTRDAADEDRLRLHRQDQPTSPLGYLTPATLIARRMLRALVVTLKLAALV